MAGKHRAKKRQPEAYVWLGTGAMTLGLGVALAAGSGVAQADATNASVGGSGVTPSPGSSAATTSIRTTISAQSVNTSTNSSTPVVAGEEKSRHRSSLPTIPLSDKWIRRIPVITMRGAIPPSRATCSDLITPIRASWELTLVRLFRSSSWAVVAAACSRGSQVLSASSSAANFLARRGRVNCGSLSR